MIDYGETLLGAFSLEILMKVVSLLMPRLKKTTNAWEESWNNAIIKHEFVSREQNFILYAITLSMQYIH